MDSNAKAYCTLSKPQYDIAYDFIRSLKIARGYKVLDMGCGTGNVTKCIADIVGDDGEVVGVDPDEARVTVAKEKFTEVQNLRFHVADSTTGFPHDNDEYYDVHFSSSAFHWLIGNNKNVYLEKAYQCLKPGGVIALVAGVMQEDDLRPKGIAIELLTEKEYRQLFEADVGLFTNVTTETSWFVFQFTTFELFELWFKTTYHRALNELDQDWVKSFLDKYITRQTDGGCTFRLGTIRVTANKKSGLC